MTKFEFDDKFNSVFNSKFEEFSNLEYIQGAFSNYADENNKISYESVAVFALLESIKFNKNFLKTLLTDVLEFDE